jgi:serine/tyrosine/threonine adenylyltransferase
MPSPLENSYTRLPERLYERIRPASVEQPELLLFNEPLARELGLTVEEFVGGAGAELLSGRSLWPGSIPLALGYAGHQFGNFVPQLGDGRAHLLGEIVTSFGARYDIQLKGSGPTKYSRGGDGRAALGPVLREYLVSEAMFALGVPTTRALAAVTTGLPVYRQSVLPGAILTRVAKSHLRIGTFEYRAAQEDVEGLSALVDYALERHFPDSDDGRPPALRLLDSVISVQAQLIAQWMHLGFVHGVMNTDNCMISGETIDYGPCAFLDTYEPTRTFSSIDRVRRYAFHHQPAVALWNLARLAESLLPLIHPEEEKAARLATDVLKEFQSRYDSSYARICGKKLGVGDAKAALKLNSELLSLMRESRADFTLTYRALADCAKSQDFGILLARLGDTEHLSEAARTTHNDVLSDWIERYQQALDTEPQTRSERVTLMRQANPLFIPRNHRVEEVLSAAQTGDMAPFHRLLRAVQNPFETPAPESDLHDLAAPPGDEQWSHVTFCGT